MKKNNQQVVNNETMAKGASVEIDARELEAIAATLPVRSKVRAGQLLACCGSNPDDLHNHNETVVRQARQR
ncbi:hypothetical protein SBA3_2330013 [Candidatus Sulfopaludibacter sp. SbA3]|nr:hypothetical protein SBA3_2330013 [Candidatus Sulfopaludibacter sp. SbA3]